MAPPRGGRGGHLCRSISCFSSSCFVYNHPPSALYIRYTVKHPPGVACCYQVISNIKYQAGNQSSSAGVCFSLYWLLAFSFVATPRLFPIRPPRRTIFGDAGGGSQCSEVRPPPPDYTFIFTTGLFSAPPSLLPPSSPLLHLPSIVLSPPPHYLIH